MPSVVVLSLLTLVSHLSRGRPWLPGKPWPHISVLGSLPYPLRKLPSNYRQIGYSPPLCFVKTHITEHGPFGSPSFGDRHTCYKVLSISAMCDAGLGVLRYREVALFYIRMSLSGSGVEQAWFQTLAFIFNSLFLRL